MRTTTLLSELSKIMIAERFKCKKQNEVVRIKLLFQRRYFNFRYK